MAKTIKVDQSTTEEKEYAINWATRLPTGVTVTGITTTHAPPSGSAVTPVNDFSAAPITYTYMPAGLVIHPTRPHYLDIVATTSNSAISPHVRFEITVKY